MWIIWDILTVAIVLVFAFSCYHKGFLYAVTRLVGTVGALLFSLFYSLPIAGMLYERYLRIPLLEVVEKHVGEITQNGLATFTQGLESLFDSLPSSLSHPLAEMLGGSAEEWYLAAQGADAASLTLTLTDTVVGPLAVALVRVLVFCLLFAVLVLLVNLIANLMRSVNYLPVIGSFNELLGGALGAVQGLLYVFVFAALLWLVVSSIDGVGILSHEQIGKTYLFRYFYFAGPWAQGLW